LAQQSDSGFEALLKQAQQIAQNTSQPPMGMSMPPHMTPPRMNPGPGFVAPMGMPHMMPGMMPHPGMPPMGFGPVNPSMMANPMNNPGNNILQSMGGGYPHPAQAQAQTQAQQQHNAWGTK